MPAIDRKHLGRYLRGLAGPMLLWVFAYLTLREPLQAWLHIEETYDQDAMHEWIKEAVVFRLTLPELVGQCRHAVDDYARAVEADTVHGGLQEQFAMTKARQAVNAHLMAL